VVDLTKIELKLEQTYREWRRKEKSRNNTYSFFNHQTRKINVDNIVYSPVLPVIY
jgi:hypothetical protein